MDAKDSEVAADAVVVWVREASHDPEAAPGMGLRFVGIDEAGVRTIRQYIERQEVTAMRAHA
jgi:c-di-GMP-binding flagellar brake protein YcgR